MKDVIVTLLILGLIAFGIHLHVAKSAKSRASLYNRLYGTSYTTGDLYWNNEEIYQYHKKNNPERPKTNEINATLKLT